MLWLWITSVFCVVCIAPQYGAHAQTNANTLQPQSGMKEVGSGVADRPSQNLTGTQHAGTKSLDDLSLDDIPVMTDSVNATMCQGKYAVGEMFAPNCEERCRCVAGGRVVCEPRCELPLVRRRVLTDPLCTEKPSHDECCILLTCQLNHEERSEEGHCIHKNETFKSGVTWNDGCLSVCSCAAGVVDCKARCPPTNATADKEGCVSLPDRNDPCCTVILCDVNLAESEEGKPGGADLALSDEITLSSADALNGTAAIVHFVGEPMLDVNLTAEASEDGSTWQPASVDAGIIGGLTPGRAYHLRLLSAGRRSNAVMVDLPMLDDMSMGREMSKNTTATMSPSSGGGVAVSSQGIEYCTFKGHNYSLGQEFNDECTSFCICTDTGVDCSPIECPSEFGLDVLDPTCLKWETQPRNFSPKPPNCCSDNAKCLDNGSCNFMGQNYANWAEIPSNITGCERKCYCELGNVTCQDVCAPLASTPPADLPCPAAMAQQQLLPGDSCCRFWVCPPSHSSGETGGGVVVQVLEPLDEHTVRLAFSVPPILVGLHGRVEVRYTPDKHELDPATWERQVLAPPGDLIATPQLHFDLGNLIPDTTYSIFIKVILRGISNAVESPILSVKTLASADTTTLPPQISIDPQLSAMQVNATWATIKWRKFTDFELQFIDGLQLRFREHDGKVFSATPLIHRSVTLYSFPDLKPNTPYEVGLFFIPFPGQTTELQSDKNINFVTAVETDPYRFDIELDIVAIKSTGVEVTWTGVPYPEDKYVNIYRVIYQSESGKEDFNSFKVAKRDSTPKITVLDLKPTTRYRLWLEAYLTNGRTKKSNVQDFVTKPGVQAAGVSSSGKLSGSAGIVESGDYYGPLVAVAVLAALAIMAALILVLVLMKKNGQNKAPITVRQTQSAYDNPSYKTSENDIPMNGNGSAHNNMEDGTTAVP